MSSPYPERQAPGSYPLDQRPPEQNTNDPAVDYPSGPHHGYDPYPHRRAQTEPEPPIDELLQEPIATVPVSVEGLVSVREVPKVEGIMRSLNVQQGGVEQMFPDDPRRSMLTLIVNTGPIVVANSAGEAASGGGAILPTGAVVQIRHRKRIWVNALAPANPGVLSYILELFAD